MQKVTLMSVMSVMALTLAGCAAAIGTSPNGLEIPIEKAAIKFSADVKDGGYKVVTTEELKSWFDEGRNLVVVGTLSLTEERMYGALPGAVNAATPRSEQDLTPEDKEHLLRAAGDDKNRTLVIHGSFVACRRSHVGARFLVENGYRNVYRYPAGIAGWAEAGYPLVK